VARARTAPGFRKHWDDIVAKRNSFGAHEQRTCGDEREQTLRLKLAVQAKHRRHVEWGYSSLSLLCRRSVHLAGEKYFFGRAIVRDELTAKFAERSCCQVRANVSHQLQEHVRVVNTHHAQAENLVHVQ
jgi:hypothetical protein